MLVRKEESHAEIAWSVARDCCCSLLSGVFLKIVGLLFFLTCLQAPCYAGDENFSKALCAYKQKDYAGACKLFEKAKGEDPYNAEARYYLANSYMFLHDGKAAMKEYWACFELEPLSQHGQLARQALLGFGKKFNGFSKQADSKRKVAADEPRSIKQSVALIKKQSCERESLNHAGGERFASRALAGGEERNQRLNAAAEALARDLTPPNNQMTPTLQQELHEIRQRAVFAGQHARQNAQQEAAKHMAAAAARSVSIEASAASLLSLIAEDPRPGRLKLKAAGTNLYVRNYGFEPGDPLKALVAEWEKISSPENLNKSKKKFAANKTTAMAAQAAPGLKAASRQPALRAGQFLKAQKSPASSNLKRLPKSEEAYPELSSTPHKWDAAFVPGSSKIVVTDVYGHVLLHLKEDKSR